MLVRHSFAILLLVSPYKTRRTRLRQKTKSDTREVIVKSRKIYNKQKKFFPT
jgi:hypothetical protein